MGEENKLNVEEVRKKLSEPFAAEDVEWRVLRSAKKNNKPYAFVIPYLKSRAIQTRLDTVVGIDNWENEFKETKTGFICGIRIWFSDEKSRIKWDGADCTNVEATKGGMSNALKRAAVEWGIGRYLYNCKEVYVEIHNDRTKGDNYIKDNKTGVTGHWKTPSLPQWALPEGEKQNSSSSSRNNDARNRSQGNQTMGNQNQRSQTRMDDMNKGQLLTLINNFEKQIGLTQQPTYIPRIFNKANNTNVKTVADMRGSSDEQLKAYYKVLKPVNDVCVAVYSNDCSEDDLLQFVQIVKPDHRIDSVFSLFFILNPTDVSEILNLAKQHYTNRKQGVSA